MAQAGLIASSLQRSLVLLKRHLADLSDEDLMVRPVPGANHAAYQVAHAANLQVKVANLLSESAPVPVPEGFERAVDKEAPASDDPTRFPRKAVLEKLFEQATNAITSALDGMGDEDLARPSPEHFRRFAPTLADLLLLASTHTAMHVGQIQVIRRTLGKPHVM